MLLMSMLGASEILFIAAFVGAVSGYFFRPKENKKAVLLGVVLGAIGGMLVSYLLLTYLMSGLRIGIGYAILGSWLFNFIWKLVKKDK